jgi:hypothetical protein
MAFSDFALVFSAGFAVGAATMLLYVVAGRSEPKAKPTANSPAVAPGRIIPPQGGSGTSPPSDPEPLAIIPFPRQPLKLHQPCPPVESGDMLRDDDYGDLRGTD